MKEKVGGNHPAVVAHNRKQHDDKHLNRLACYNMRLKGYTYEQIAKELGVSAQTARSYFVKYAGGLEKEKLEEVRALELARLDKLQLAVDSVVELATNMVHNTAACDHCKRPEVPVNTLVKLMDRVNGAARTQVATQESRRKLLGIDAAEKVHIEIEEKTQAEINIDKLIREANERVRAEEKDMKEAGRAAEE